MFPSQSWDRQSYKQQWTYFSNCVSAAKRDGRRKLAVRGWPVELLDQELFCLAPHHNHMHGRASHLVAHRGSPKFRKTTPRTTTKRTNTERGEWPNKFKATIFWLFLQFRLPSLTLCWLMHQSRWSEILSRCTCTCFRVSWFYRSWKAKMQCFWRCSGVLARFKRSFPGWQMFARRPKLHLWRRHT